MTVRQGVAVGIATALAIGAAATITTYRLINQAIEGAWR